MSDVAKTTSVNVPGTASPKPQPNWVPSQKILAGGLGGLTVWIVTYALRKYANIELDAQLQSALIGWATIMITYLTPAAAQDVVRSLNNEIVAMAQADQKSPVTVPVVTAAPAVNVVVGTQTPADKGSQE